MTREPRGLVLFGDVVRSRDDLQASTRWLRALTADLERVYSPEDRLAPIGFTQGDELQALLEVEADPFVAVLHASLHPEALEMRWVVAAGSVQPGRGPTTERTGRAFLLARDLLDTARARRERLLVAAGSEPADSLLADLAPLLGDLLGDLTDRQRAIAQLMLVDGLRQSDVAGRLGVSRATISVMAERARIRRIEALVRALRRILADGIRTDGDGRG